MSRPEPGGGMGLQDCFHLFIQLATVTMIQRVLSLLAFVSVFYPFGGRPLSRQLRCQ